MPIRRNMPVSNKLTRNYINHIIMAASVLIGAQNLPDSGALAIGARRVITGDLS